LIPDLERCVRLVPELARPFYRGRVEVVSGVLVEAAGVRAALGEVCRIDRGRLGIVDAEVVGFRGSSALLMPHGDLVGIAPGQEVVSTGRTFEIGVSEDLLGRVLDGFASPLDGGPRVSRAAVLAVRREAPPPLERVPIDAALPTGVRVVDGLNTIGRGQRLGVFAGSGVGKSTLLGQITRGTEAEVVVCCLVGERGREVRAFVEEVLGEAGRTKSVLVVATSDRPPIERFLAPFVAVTIAEFFRDSGRDVLMVMDSVTRFAGASREIGLAAGEPPTVRGYPPSFFATVPKLLERMGRTRLGSITGLITVLLENDDPNEPVADTLRGLLDGHLLLSRELFQAGHFPAVDVLGSLSRLMPDLAPPDVLRRAAALRDALAAHREGRDLIEIGAYKAGTNPRLDRALELLPTIETFLRQPLGELTPIEHTLELLARVADRELET